MSKYSEEFMQTFGGTKKIREATPGLKDLKEFKVDQDKNLKEKIKKMLKN